MICYRDRTYCEYYEDCSNAVQNGGECDRGLTRDVLQKVDKAGLFISCFAQRPDCYCKVDQIKYPKNAKENKQ